MHEIKKVGPEKAGKGEKGPQVMRRLRDAFSRKESKNTTLPSQETIASTQTLEQLYKLLRTVKSIPRPLRYSVPDSVNEFQSVELVVSYIEAFKNGNYRTEYISRISNLYGLQDHVKQLLLNEILPRIEDFEQLFALLAGLQTIKGSVQEDGSRKSYLYSDLKMRIDNFILTGRPGEITKTGGLRDRCIYLREKQNSSRT
jgi:hypothetical protein